MTSQPMICSNTSFSRFCFSFSKLLFVLVLVVSFGNFSVAQTFTNQTSLLSDTTVYSGAAIGIADMDGDGKDDIVRLDDARILKIEYQRTTNGAFDSYTFGNLSGSGNEWGLCIADVDNNGYNDFVAGGAYNGLKLLTANSTGTDYTQTVLSGSIFLQAVNLVDINNDGWIDLFACHDDDDNYSYRNQGNGTFVIDHNLIDTGMASGNSGNYGSVWTDYDNDGDIDLYISKCRGGVSNPNDPRRINRLLQNDGSNNFSDMGPAAGLNDGAQSWATDFADIDNDGDLDCFILNHDVDSCLMRNNGDGTFTDITAAAGFSSSDLNFIGIQCVFRDFDNDCFVDLLVTGSQHRYFKNNGDGTFTRITGLFGSNDMESCAVGDLNGDGYVDIYGGYAFLYNSPSNTPDALFMNNGGTNNYFAVELEGITSNINGVGARVELIGSWGKQIREIRAGEGYGISHSHTAYFGIGIANEIERLIIRWPSGTVDVVDNPTINSKLSLVEGSTLPIQIFPDSYTLPLGNVLVGDLDKVDESDDDYLVLTHQFSKSTYMQVNYQVKAVSPVPSPSRLDFILETSLQTKPRIEQKILLFNYDTSQFEEVDLRATTLQDQIITVETTGDLSRFVEDGTGCVEARIEIEPKNSVPFRRTIFRVKIDQIKWLIE